MEILTCGKFIFRREILNLSSGIGDGDGLGTGKGRRLSPFSYKDELCGYFSYGRKEGSGSGNGYKTI